MGTLLLALNIVGLFQPLRDPALASEKELEVKAMPLLSEKQFYERIQRNGETDREYATNVNEAVFEGLLQYRPVEGHLKHNWDIPVTENYLIWLSRRALFVERWLKARHDPDARSPETALIYDFSSARKVIERGIGLCSQHAVALIGFLEAQGIQASYVSLGGTGLGGHVVVEATVDKQADTKWILDPYYGVVIRYSFEQLKTQPDLARSYYENAGYNAKTVDVVMAHYHGNRLIRRSGVQEAHGRARYDFEFASYYLIWVIPAFLMLPSIRTRKMGSNSHFGLAGEE